MRKELCFIDILENDGALCSALSRLLQWLCPNENESMKYSLSPSHIPIALSVQGRRDSEGRQDYGDNSSQQMALLSHEASHEADFIYRSEARKFLGIK